MTIRTPVRARTSPLSQLATGAAALLFAGTTVLASQPQGAQNGQPAAGARNQPFLTIASFGAEAWLRSPKDQWMKAALQQMEANGLDLPPALLQEMDNNPAVRPAAKLALDLLMTRWSASVALATPKQGGPPQPQAQFSFMGNERRSGDSLKADFDALLAASGAQGMFEPVEGKPSLSMARPNPDTSVYFGTGEVGGKGATVISVGKPPATEAVSLERFGVPAGMEPQLAFELDFRPLQPFLAMADAMIPPGPDGSSQLEKLGVVGKDPMVVRGLLANSATEGAAVLRLVNGAKAPEYKNLYSGTLKPADLQWLPVDARSASLSRTDFSRVYSQMLDQIETQMDAMGGGEDGFEEDSKGEMGDKGAAGSQGGGGHVSAMVRQVAGIDLRKDLLAPLGDLSFVYRSESTGGGGLLSYVFGVTLKDPATMKNTLATLAGRLNEAAGPLQGVVSLRKRAVPGCDAFYTLVIAGLPIPLQPAIGIGQNALVVGLLPQSVQAAVAQHTARTSLADHPGFKSMNGAADLAGAVSINWIDVPANLKDGYGVLLAAGTAMSNMTARRGSDESPLGPMVPSLADLAKDAKPTITTTRLDGDDLLVRLRCDPSFSVQLAGVAGEVGVTAPLIGAAMAGVMLPALGKARAAAREARDASILRNVMTAAIVYASDNKDSLPPSLEALEKYGVSQDLLDSLSDDGGLTGELVYMPPAERKLSSVMDPTACPILWQGYHMWPKGGVWVAFGDGHVERVMSEKEFLGATAPATGGGRSKRAGADAGH